MLGILFGERGGLYPVDIQLLACIVTNFRGSFRNGRTRLLIFQCSPLSGLSYAIDLIGWPQEEVAVLVAMNITFRGWWW